MTETKVEQLRRLITELHNECGVVVEPLFPKILVRVLPREQKIGSIITPDSVKQNKPVLEGVVLKVYKPFFQKVYLAEINWRTKENWDPKEKYLQRVESAVKVGDHVLFPHIDYGITPVWPLDGGVGDYRLIREEHLFGTVNYDRKPILEEFAGFLYDTDIVEGTYQSTLNDVVQSGLFDKFDVVPRNLESKTLSGV